jgi:hypothetical protein
VETFLGFMIGIGLSAACGFRIFVPLLGVSIASMSGYLTLTPSFAWLGTWAAFSAFATATVLEIGAYYVPWLDNLLDTLATPAAVVAGTIVTASLVGNMNPFLKCHHRGRGNGRSDPDGHRAPEGGVFRNHRGIWKFPCGDSGSDRLHSHHVPCHRDSPILFTARYLSALPCDTKACSAKAGCLKHQFPRG